MKRVIFLILISLLPLLDLLQPGLPRGHDTPDHVARIANFYQSLTEGNFLPRWAGNLNWGYGHPILMFLYPLPSYIASLFHAVGFSFVDSTKLVFGVAYILSALTMYLWMSSAFGNRAGFLGALLYIFAPYRFVDLYVRGAIGEHVAFIFPPVIFWGLFKLANLRFRESSQLLPMLAVTLGMAGLLLSHNAVALMMLPLIFLYGVYLFFFFVSRGARSRFAGLGAWCLMLGFLLSVFFWVPAFFEGKYTLRDIVTKGDFTSRFVPWQWFFVSPWNYGGGGEFTKELGFVHWLGILGSIVVLFRAKARPVRWFIGGCIVAVGASIFLMTSGSKVVWEQVTILQKFQFPWRFLTIPVIGTSILGAITLTHVPKRLHLSIVFCLLSFIAITTSSMWRTPEYIVKPDAYYGGIYDGTTDTGESSPIWSIRFMEHRPKVFYEVIEGEAAIVPVWRNSTRHEFIVSAKTNARVVDNTLYFPGWTVAVDGRPLDLVDELIFQDPNYRGLMTFRVPPGTRRVVVSFGNTKLRKFANLISIVGLMSLIVTSYMVLVSSPRTRGSRVK